jgi:hypothetical protein
MVEHAQRRFIHEELFQRHSISQNRDFLLSLDLTVVYQVSQLWIALRSHTSAWQGLRLGAFVARRRRVDPLYAVRFVVT